MQTNFALPKLWEAKPIPPYARGKVTLRSRKKHFFVEFFLFGEQNCKVPQNLTLRARLKRLYCPPMSGLGFARHAMHSGSGDDLAVLILEANGPFTSISNAWKLMGYPTAEAARKAASRNRMPIAVLSLPDRRGRFVRSVDLAAWLFDSLAGATPRERNASPLEMDRQKEGTPQNRPSE